MEQEFMGTVDDIKAMPYGDVINTIIANIPEDEIRRLNSIIESHNGQPPWYVQELAVSTVDGVEFGIRIDAGRIEYSIFREVNEVDGEFDIDMIASYSVEIERIKNRNYLIYSQRDSVDNLRCTVIDRVRDTKNIGLLIVLD